METIIDLFQPTSPPGLREHLNQGSMRPERSGTLELLSVEHEGLAFVSYKLPALFTNCTLFQVAFVSVSRSSPAMEPDEFTEHKKPDCLIKAEF